MVDDERGTYSRCSFSSDERVEKGEAAARLTEAVVSRTKA